MKPIYRSRIYNTETALESTCFGEALVNAKTLLFENRDEDDVVIECEGFEVCHVNQNGDINLWRAI